MKQADEREVGDRAASTSGDGLVPRRLVEREVEESVLRAGAKPLRSWVRAANSEAGIRVTIRSWPKWVSDRLSTDDCRKWV